MGTINLYNSIDNSHQTINGCGKLSDLIPASYLNNNTIYLKAGEKIGADYFVNSEDVLYVRKTPSAVTTVVAVALATATVVMAGVTIGLGFKNYVDGKVKEQQEKAQRDAQNLAQQIQQLPFVKGANNKSALGQVVPFVMGDVYHTPYKMTDGFYSIADGDLTKNEFGSKQYYNVLLNLGFGNQQIKEVLIGSDSVLKNNSGIAEGVHNFDAGSVFYDSENKIEICQNGSDFTTTEFKQKVICNQDGSEIKHDFGVDSEPLIRTLADYTQKVEVCIQFNGLREYDSSSSNWKKRKATVRAYWTNVENPTDVDWNEFYFDNMTNNTIELQTNKTIRFVATKTFTASETYGKTIKIKLDKTTAKLESNSNEECYLVYYKSYCYDNRTSSASSLVSCKPVDSELVNKTTRIAIRVLANDNTKDMLNEIHCLVCGLAKTWNGSSWSETKTPIRNPASWILEILTNNAHFHSKYNENEIDLESLGRLYNYCNTNNFYTDGILTSGIKKRELISSILSTVNSDIIINADGLLEVVTDELEDTPVALLNAENISSITYSKDFSRKPDGLKVTFTNRDSWQVDTFYSFIEENHVRSQEDTLTETNLNYVTTYNHAYKIAQRKMRQQILQPKELKVDVGREGDYYPLYSTVLLQYTTFRIGLNSSVVAGLIKNNTNDIVGVRLADMVEMETGKTYGLIVQAVTDAGKKTYYKKVKFSLGKTNQLEFNERILASESVLPEVDNTCSFGVLDDNGNFSKITDTMKIVGIQPNGSNGYSLSLKNYNESMYDFGTIPEYKSNITEPPKPIKEIPNFEKLEGQPGENGFSSYTLQLFKRYADTPELPAGTLTYTFNPPSLSGDLDGWTTSMPEVDNDNNPLYETHVTIINQNNTVEITAEYLSEPVIVLKDSNITIAEIQEMINKVTPPPTIESDVTFFGIAVDENGICKKTQSVTTEIHVRQIEEELGFTFGDIVLPSGFTYTIDGNKITITCSQDTFVKSGSIIVPIKYRAYKSNIAYVNDSDANNYYIASGNVLGNFDNVADIPSSPADNSIVNWVGETTPMSRSDEEFETNTAYQYIAGKWQKFDFTPYGYYIYEEEITVSNIGIGYTQVKGFRYFNAITSLSNIPASSELVIGDWFTWNGEDTNSTLVEGGVFKQCCLYSWNGEKWEQDTSTDHNTRAIFDILALADSKLKQNNSKAETFLNSLCSNKAFIETLVVSGSAFINQLSTISLTLQENGLIKSENFSDTLNTGFKISADGKAVFNNVKVRGDVVANSLTIGSDVSIPEENIEGLTQSLESKADSSTVDSLTITVNGKADSSTVESLSTTVSNKADSSTVETLSQTVEGKADKSEIPDVSNDIIEQHKIYCAISRTIWNNNNHRIPTAPSTYITDYIILDSYSQWSTVQVVVNDAVLYTCVQQKKKNGSCVNLDVTLEVKGVIDTRTGYMNMNYIESESIKADKIDSEDLFSTNITIKNDGTIKSDNYVENEKGFKISSEKIEIGDGDFRGNINNLVLDVKKPNLKYINYSGKVSNCPFFKQVGSPYTIGDEFYYDAEYKIYRGDNDWWFSLETILLDGDHGDGVAQWGSEQQISMSGYYFLDNTKNFNEIFMNGIPAENNSMFNINELETNQLYIDSDGFVKIKQ